MVLFALTVTTVLTVLLSIPIAFSLGISATLAVITMGDIPLKILPQKLYSGMDSFPLLCVPFFIFAGELMAQGKLTEKILDFATKIVGRIRGGLAQANVLSSMFFGGMSGSCLADVSALGSVEIPMMVKAGYDRRFSAAVTCASAIIGPIIPPSIPVVIYALAVGTSIGGLFLAGVVPGIILGLALMAGSFIISIKRDYPKSTDKFTVRGLYISFKKVILALFMPAIIVGGIVFGIFTPTEASAIAVGYALIVTILIYKTIRLADLPAMLIRSGVTTAAVMFIVGTSNLWGWVIATEQLADKLGVFLQAFGPISFLMMVNIFFLILGTSMDNVPAILIFAPTLAPIATELGIHPLHFGMIVVLNTTIGFITPPLGEVLFVACPIAEVTLEELSREIIFFVFIEIAVLLLVTYFPFTTLFVPSIFGII